MFSFEVPNRRKEEERLRNENRLPPGTIIDAQVSGASLRPRAIL